MDYFDLGGRKACWVVHRRGGKDLTAMHQLCKMAHERRGAYWHVFPTFEQGRKAIWEGFRSDERRIIDNVFPSALIARRDNQQMMLELKSGSIYRVMGSDKIEVVGAGPVGVIYSEYSIQKPKTADLIAPMLRENRGWESYVYTPRGNNHGKKLYDSAKGDASWFCELQSLYDTRAFDPDETLADERRRGRPEAIIRQEYLCDWTAANVGSVWGDLVEALEKRDGVADFEHPTDGVFTTWDLGISDAMAVWFWRVNASGVPDVIDHLESTGKPLSYYFDEVEGRGYKYVKHWLPHDARARTFQTGVSTLEMTIKRWGADKVGITPELSLSDGIQAARWLLQQSIRIHSRCVDGIEALRAYHYAWDEDRKVFSSKPEHDWSSHTSDAFRYVACVVRASEFLAKRADNTKPARPQGTTLNDLWDAMSKGPKRERV